MTQMHSDGIRLCCDVLIYVAAIALGCVVVALGCASDGFLARMRHPIRSSCRYDSRVKAMEVDERPTEQYSDIGGLDKQIQEVRTHLIN